MKGDTNLTAANKKKEKKDTKKERGEQAATADR
jgi:hypothetical protein